MRIETTWPMKRKSSELEGWTRRLLRSDPPRSKSLIVTIFGDSLLPYVSEVWLGELIALLEPFAVNAQLARTSAFRLASEGWLRSRREGRSSRYGLTGSGRTRVEHAYHRIYDPPAPQWDGNWTIVIPGKDGSSISARAELRRELEWAGFGRVAARLFLHPRADAETLAEILARLGLSQDVVTLRARDLADCPTLSVNAFTSECWNLERVAAQYRSFLKHFQTVLPMLKSRLDPHLDPQTAFVLQTLLIHSFRRVILHDPRLPPALLPQDWPGHAAYDLCRQVYRRTHQPVLTYLTEHLEEARQRVFAPSSEFLRRFGGLT